MSAAPRTTSSPRRSRNSTASSRCISTTPKIRRSAAGRSLWSNGLTSSMPSCPSTSDVLTHAGRLRMDVAQKLAVERFETFDANRRAAEALAADAQDIAQLEEMEKAAKKGRKKGGDNA